MSQHDATGVFLRYIHHLYRSRLDLPFQRKGPILPFF